MNNENQDQNNQQLENKVPKDLLILVNHPNSPVNNENSNLKINSEDNIFIKDSIDIKENNANRKNEITDDKLNALLGLPSISSTKNTSDLNTTIINNVSNANDTDADKVIIEEKKQLLTDSNINFKKNENVSGMDLDTLMKNTYNYKIELEKKTTRSNKWFLIAAVGSGVCFVIILIIAIFSGGINFSFRGEKAYYQNKIIDKSSEFQTAVVTDNMYTNVTVNNKDDAKALIVKDSDNQKNKCENDKVKEVEARIEQKYDIVAVNLCELDYKFALEIEKVLDNIHKEFPTTIKGHLTNLTLSNMGEYGSIASFVSAKLFAKSNTLTTYPNVYKTSIFLNAEYFLNLDRFTVDMQQSEGVWFVNNATKSSIVAHEFGHYLSFLAQLNNTQDISDVILLTRKNYSNYSNLINDSNEGVFSLKIIQEAYENSIKQNSSQYDDIEEFRSSISEYAASTDDYGEPIYDETIAEAYHDWYLNKEKAADASKEIVSVLKKYINN